MKKTSILFKFMAICFLLNLPSSVYAYYVYTPKGSPVYVTSYAEMSNQEISNELSYVRSTYPNATILGNPTYSYNCHNYAWNMTEGGIAWWMNNTDLHKYWDDFSYVESTFGDFEKLFYYRGDHSAVVSKQYYGKYESKWGRSCLMRHDIAYGPSSYQMSFRKYYKKNLKIDGPEMIGGSEVNTYSVPYIPHGTALTWSYPNDLSLVSQSSTSIQLRATNPNQVGDVTVLAYFVNSGNVNVYTERLYVGLNGVHYNNVDLRVTSSSTGAEVYPSGTGLSPNSYYYANLEGVSACSSIEWEPDSHLQNQYSYGSQMYFSTDSQGWGMLNVYGTVSKYGKRKLIKSATLYGGY